MRPLRQQQVTTQHNFRQTPPQQRVRKAIEGEGMHPSFEVMLKGRVTDEQFHRHIAALCCHRYFCAYLFGSMHRHTTGSVKEQNCRTLNNWLWNIRCALLPSYPCRSRFRGDLCAMNVHSLAENRWYLNTNYLTVDHLWG
ncbi:hypothetical protein DSECCO2_453830 [anaerobic digester metagenome]